MPRPQSADSLAGKILKQIRAHRPAHGLKLLSPSDFAALGSRRAVDVALHRLVDRGALRRVARGLYYVPHVHPVLGALDPTPEAIAQALATKHRLRLQPSGAYAANLLGLSEQVPLRLVYLTDGPNRRMRVGQQEIVFRHTTPRNMATAGRTSGLVIQALRHLGQRHADQAVVDRLRRRLSDEDRARLADDIPLAPAWIGEIMRQVAEADAR